jgi:hypothetical protein
MLSPPIITLRGFIVSVTILDTLSDDMVATFAVMDDTLSVDVLIESKAIRLDTTRVEGIEAKGGYALPLTDDTKSCGVDTCISAVRVDTTRFAGIPPTGGG